MFFEAETLNIANVKFSITEKVNTQLDLLYDLQITMRISQVPPFVP
jgi:hypothetical protein